MSTISNRSIEAAIEEGIEAASEMVSNLLTGQQAWDRKEYQIAETAARAATNAIINALRTTLESC